MRERSGDLSGIAFDMAFEVYGLGAMLSLALSASA